ncbi:MAG: glycoside hydrolase family 16 protein [Candidatus Limimorpha sp.]
MKKLVSICCCLLAIIINARAQITSDSNWEVLFEDNFTENRYWNPTTWFSIPDLEWKAYTGYQITHGIHECQIYQYDKCQFDVANGTMKLVSEYDWNHKIPNHEYALPDVLHGNYPNIYGENNSLYFFSGAMDVRQMRFSYGYFEIRCKLPIHNGSFPAFWLFGNGPNTYEEIDIFEYSNEDSDEDFYRGYSSGIWHNPNSTNYEYDETHPELGYAKKYAISYNHITVSEPDLREYHTYGCEWMPDVVRWYRDGQVVSEYFDINHIPQYPKTLKVNYALQKEGALNNDSEPDGWSGSEVMEVDYVKVYRLKTDCNTDEFITTSSQMEDFDNRMKRSIIIGSPSGSIQVPLGTNTNMHAAEHISIVGEFEVPQGSLFTLTVHSCPE